MEPGTLIIEEFCRLCLKQNRSYLPIFEKNFPEKLESLTSIKISIDDPAPNIMCASCNAEVQLAYMIQQKLIETELSLQKKIESSVEQEEDGKVAKSDPVEVKKLPNCEKMNIETDEPSYSDSDCDSSGSYSCTKCPKKFDDKLSLFKHYEIHDYRKCTMCPKTVPYLDYRDHIVIHSSGYCEYCGITFKSRHSLRNHVGKLHAEPKMTCEHCGVISDNKKSFDLHVLRMHTEEVPYICNYCGKKYFTVSQMNKHIRDKHIAGPQFNCEVCGKCFNSKSQLSAHQTTHSDVTPFICEFCGKGFKLLQNMNTHKKAVHGWKTEANFKCTICGRGFPIKRALSLHVAMHRK